MDRYVRNKTLYALVASNWCNKVPFVLHEKKKVIEYRCVKRMTFDSRNLFSARPENDDLWSIGRPPHLGVVLTT